MSGLYGVGWPDGGHYLTKKETPKGPFTLNTFLLFKKNETRGVEVGNVMNVVIYASAAVKHVCLACDYTENIQKVRQWNR